MAMLNYQKVFTRFKFKCFMLRPPVSTGRLKSIYRTPTLYLLARDPVSTPWKLSWKHETLWIHNKIVMFEHQWTFFSWFFLIWPSPSVMNAPRQGIPSVEQYWLAVPSRTMIHTHHVTISANLSLQYRTTVPPVSKRSHSWNQWRKWSQEVAYMNIYIYIHTCIYSYVCIFIVCVYIYIYMYIYMCVCVHMYMCM